jgi:hypothetical protein
LEVVLLWLINGQRCSLLLLGSGWNLVGGAWCEKKRKALCC